MYYDYFEAVKEDLAEFLKENPSCDLSDAMDADEVTGNASGSYTFNRATAAEYVGENLDLLADAISDLGAEYPRDPETADVIIRCYVLGFCEL